MGDPIVTHVSCRQPNAGETAKIDSRRMKG